MRLPGLRDPNFNLIDSGDEGRYDLSRFQPPVQVPENIVFSSGLSAAKPLFSCSAFLGVGTVPVFPVVVTVQQLRSWLGDQLCFSS